ncbi:unnamed protein product [Cuscuta europaea]|uniref:Uncharacterized protein n=1 Tax=Cuscuta europaea TaxID=41803 RepID=A0A9P0Z7W3_CUSEU|nr:unnamed protein product [Cuscuta europaea]
MSKLVFIFWIHQSQKMQRGRTSVDMGNLGWNRTKEIARNHPSSHKGKGKGRAGSSSQTRDNFETDYHRRDADAMSDEQLQQLLSQQDGRFYQQCDIPEVEDELEDDDAEEDPPTAEGEGHGTPDDEEEVEDLTYTSLSPVHCTRYQTKISLEHHLIYSNVV